MATTDQVQSLYIAYFGRPADSAGLKAWTADAETPLTTIADGFAGTAEYKAATAGESVAQIINSFYVNLFNRNAEVEGLNFWLNEIALGNSTVQNVGVVIGQEAVKADPPNDDTKCIENKFTAANQWTTDTAKTTEGILAYSGKEGVEAGQAYMSSWGTTAPTAEQTQAAVDSLIKDNPTGDTLDLTVFTDIADATGYTKLSGNTIVSTSSFKLDGDSQTVNGTFNTLQGLDTLADSSTSDKDILNVTTSGATQQATVSNIETVNFDVTGLNAILGAGTYTAGFAGAGGNVNSTFTGVKTFNVTGTLASGANAGLSALGTGASTIDTSALTSGSNATARININGDSVDTTMTGGDVRETYNAAGGSAVDTINLGAGSNIITNAGRGADVITHDATKAGSVVTVNVGGSSEITLTATSTGASAVVGALVNSKVNASTSTEAVVLTGNTGNDLLTGGSKVDTIVAGGGTDTLTGGAAADLMTITGSVGTIAYTSFAGISGETGVTQSTGDQVTGFTAADFIQTGLAGTAANTDVTGGTIGGTFALCLAAAEVLADGTHAYIANDDGTDSYVFYDADLDGDVDAVTVLVGLADATGLAAANFR